MKTYGLIGYPLAHSFSKSWFEEKFRLHHLSEHRYENFPLQHLDGLADILRKYPDLAGFNVTIPHKEAIIHYLHDLDTISSEIGAVNCVKIKDNKLTGYNTDAYGFEMSIRPFLENKYERALILGTGGASKAIAYTLRKWQIPFYFVTRSPVAENHIGYTDISSDNIRHFQLIINCTPVGTHPAVNEAPPLPYADMSSSHFLYDLVYNPSETLFLKKGKEAGAATMNGLKMLELQAEKSWQIWTA